MLSKTSKTNRFQNGSRFGSASLGPAPFAQLHLCCRDARRGQELHQAIGGLNRHGSITGNKNIRNETNRKTWKKIP